MKCPKCQATMTERPLGGARVDVCPDCEGTWFGRNELEVVRKTKTAGRRHTPTVLVPLRRPTALPCPRCGEGSELQLYKAHSFEVERCAACTGLFFDGDEMESLLAGWRRSRRRDRRRRREREEAMIGLVTGMMIAGF